MKVLVATHAYSGNGAAVMLLAVLEYWVKGLGWTVDVLLGLDKEVPEELAATGVAVFPTADAKNYDFALVNTIVSAPHLEALARQIPTVLWVHEAETVVWTSSASPLKWRQFFELPWKIVFQTRWQAEAVFRSFLPESSSSRIACVANGLPAVPANIEPHQRTLGMKRIVFAGGVYGRKRPNDLIDAVIAMGREDVECIFVGTTSNLDSIGAEYVEKLNKHPSHFILTGELDRRRTLEYIASADAFCLPSGDESQPIAPLEAAVLGIPCVLSDLPPYAGSWRHGVNCLMQPVGDHALMRWNLAALLEDPHVARRITKNAMDLTRRFEIRSFLEHFSAEMPH